MIQEETENLISHIPTNNIAIFIRNLPKGKLQARIAALVNSIEHLRKKKKPPNLHIFRKWRRRMNVLSHFGVSKSPIPNPNKSTYKNKKL